MKLCGGIESERITESGVLVKPMKMANLELKGERDRTRAQRPQSACVCGSAQSRLHMGEMVEVELPRPSAMDLLSRGRRPHTASTNTVARTAGTNNRGGVGIMRCRRLLSATSVKDQGKVQDCDCIYCR